MSPGVQARTPASSRVVATSVALLAVVLLSGLAGRAKHLGNLRPRVGPLRRAQTLDGRCDGGVHLGPQSYEPGQPLDVPITHPAGCGPKDAAGKRRVLGVLDHPVPSLG